MRRILVLVLCAAALLPAACSPSKIDKRDTSPSVPVLIYSSRDLVADLGDRIAAIDGVRSVTPTSVGVVNLVKVTGAPPLPHRRKGGILPLSIAGYDPPAGATDEMSSALAAGDAVLTQTSASLRKMGVGGTVTIAGAGATGTRITFRIGADVSDKAGLGRELIVPLRLAGGLALTAPRELQIQVAGDKLDAAVAAMKETTQGMIVRIHVGQDPAIDPNESPILSFAEVKKIFGEFTYKPRHGRFVAMEKAWVDKYIVETNVPLLGVIKCNRRLLPQLTGAMLELPRLGLAGLVRNNAGCWSPRMQVGNTFDVSRHAFGIAVDINVPENPYGDPPRQDRRLIDVMERWGFVWGGRWLIPDGMHFEFVRFVKR